MRPTGSPEELERRRQKGIALLKQGLMPVEVARRLGVDRRSVRRWRASFERGGQQGLAARPIPGRPARLDGEAKARLEALLLRGARACGFPTDLWTCPRVAQVIRKEFGVGYHADHVCRLLHSLGWTAQKPERRARERDEEAIQRWVRVDWKRVKKTSGG